MEKNSRLRLMSSRVAHLVVPSESTNARHRLVLDQTSPDLCHKLGVGGEPWLYYLQQQFAADQGWRVGANPNGKMLTPENPGSPLVKQVSDWLENESSCSGVSLVDHLPPGEYYLVRSPIKPRFVHSIFIGNEATEATANMRVIFDDKHVVHSTIIGPVSDSPPDLRQPLLGVVICHDTGIRWELPARMPHEHLVLFFPFFPAPQSEGADSDLFLIVPANGELMIDNLQLSTSPIDEEYMKRWNNHFLGNFITECTGESIQVSEKL